MYGTVYPIHQSQKGGIEEKMNTLRKMRKNAKALSPVVASIILIAVTVAVSIAVAAWMGALVVGQMSTEQLKITNVEFDAAGMIVTVRNTGDSIATVEEIYVGSAIQDTVVFTNSTGDVVTTGAIQPNSVLTISYDYAYTAGTAYQVKVVSSKGNPFVFTVTAPS